MRSYKIIFVFYITLHENIKNYQVQTNKSNQFNQLNLFVHFNWIFTYKTLGHEGRVTAALGVMIKILAWGIGYLVSGIGVSADIWVSGIGIGYPIGGQGIGIGYPIPKKNENGIGIGYPIPKKLPIPIPCMKIRKSLSIVFIKKYFVIAETKQSFNNFCY
jgi:hypothetical protein